MEWLLCSFITNRKTQKTMSTFKSIAKCSRDGKIQMNYEAYLDMLEELNAAGYELSDDDWHLLSLWWSIKDGRDCSDRYAMEFYFEVVNAIDKPQSEIEQFLYEQADNGLRSLRCSNDDYVWETLACRY